MLKDCKYRLPCGWCDKYDIQCLLIEHEVGKQEQENNSKQTECEHNWILEEQEIVNQKVCYKTYRCSICKKKHIRKDKLFKDGSINTTLWYE